MGASSSKDVPAAASAAAPAVAEPDMDVIDIVMEACNSDSSWYKKLKEWLDGADTVDTLEAALRPLLVSLSQEPEYSLGKDVKALEKVIEDTVQAMKLKLIHLQMQNEPSFNAEHAGSINIFTQGAPKAHWFAYLSKCLNAKDRFKDGQVSAKLEECRLFLKFFKVSLSFMPARFWYTGECWRGVQWVFPDLAQHSPTEWFFPGRRFYSFTMKSFSKHKDKAVGFAQPDGKGCGTLFHMHAECLAYDISEFSDFDEKEVLFPILEEFEFLEGTSANIKVSAEHKHDPKNDAHTGQPDTVEMMHHVSRRPDLDKLREVQNLERELLKRDGPRKTFEELKHFLTEGRLAPTPFHRQPLQSAQLVIELRNAIVASVEDAVKDKPVIFLVGATGSGKSTLSNWLVGHTLSQDDDDDTGPCLTIGRLGDGDGDGLSFSVGDDDTRSRTLIPTAVDLGKRLGLPTEFQDLSLVDFPGFFDQSDTEYGEFRIAIDLAFRELVNMSSKTYALFLIEISAAVATKGDAAVEQVRKMMRHLPVQADGKLAWRLGVTKCDEHFEGRAAVSKVRRFRKKVAAVYQDFEKVDSVIDINEEIFEVTPSVTPRAFLEKQFLGATMLTSRSPGRALPVVSEHLDTVDLEKFEGRFRSSMSFLIEAMSKDFKARLSPSQPEQQQPSWEDVKKMISFAVAGMNQFADELVEDAEKMRANDPGYLFLQRMFPEIDELCQSRQVKIFKAFSAVEKELCNMHIQHLIEEIHLTHQLLNYLNENNCIRAKDFEKVQCKIDEANTHLNERCRDMGYQDAADFFGCRSGKTLAMAAGVWGSIFLLGLPFAGASVAAWTATVRVITLPYWAVASTAWVGADIYLAVSAWAGAGALIGSTVANAVRGRGDCHSAEIRKLLVSALAAIKKASDSCKEHALILGKIGDRKTE